MNGIAFAPQHDMSGRDDVTTSHQPLSREWCAERYLPPPVTYDNRKPPSSRALQITRELQRSKTKFDAVAFFGHASAIGIQAGYHIEDVPMLALVLAACVTERGSVEFYAIDPIVDTSGLCRDAGFADRIRCEMHKTGRWQGQVIAHAVGTHGPVARIFEGPADVAGVWVKT